MATTKQIDVNGTSVTVVEFDHTAQEIDDAVDKVANVSVGGGVTSWDDLTDRPFFENDSGGVRQIDNRFLAILEKTEETELVPAQELAFSKSGITNSNGSVLYTCNYDPGVSLQEGKEYIVEFGDRKYHLIAKYHEDNLVRAYYLGNFALLWSGVEELDTEESLLIMWSEGETNLLITTSEEGESHTFGITQVAYKVKEEYLPESSNGGESDADLEARVATLEEQVTALEQQDEAFTEAAEAAVQELQELAQRVTDLEGASGLPAVTEEDNDKILQVVDGAWAVVSLADSAVKTYIDAYISEALGGEY